MRNLAPFSTYLRGFVKSQSPIKGQSALAPLARGEAVFMVLLVRLAECRPAKERSHERPEADSAGGP